jgi:hypothetical protein
LDENELDQQEQLDDDELNQPIHSNDDAVEDEEHLNEVASPHLDENELDQQEQLNDDELAQPAQLDGANELAQPEQTVDQPATSTPLDHSTGGENVDQLPSAKVALNEDAKPLKRPFASSTGDNYIYSDKIPKIDLSNPVWGLPKDWDGIWINSGRDTADEKPLRKRIKIVRTQKHSQ